MTGTSQPSRPRRSSRTSPASASACSTARASTSMLFLLALTILMLSISSPLAASPSEGADTDTGWGQLVASVLDWLAIGGDNAELHGVDDAGDEAEPLPGMGFEIEPNG